MLQDWDLRTDLNLLRTAFSKIEGSSVLLCRVRTEWRDQEI